MKFLKKTQWAALSLLLFACQNQADTPKKTDLNNFQFLEITIPELQEGYKNGGNGLSEMLSLHTATA
jgi:hypothetical protein